MSWEMFVLLESKTKMERGTDLRTRKKIKLNGNVTIPIRSRTKLDQNSKSL